MAIADEPNLVYCILAPPNYHVDPLEVPKVAEGVEGLEARIPNDSEFDIARFY